MSNNIEVNIAMRNRDNVIMFKIFEGIETDINNCTIIFKYEREDFLVKLNSNNFSEKELECLFWNFYNYLGFILGYFPDIKYATFANEKMLAQILERYKTNVNYIRGDFHFITKISEEDFKKSFSSFMNFYKQAELQIAMYNISMMKSNCYPEIAIVNLLQSFDGIFDKLKITKNRNIIVKSKSKLEKIRKKIKKIDIMRIIKNKSQSDIIKKNLLDSTIRINYLNYDTILKILFNYVDKFSNIFKVEKNIKDKNKTFDKFIIKCKHTRNKLSHVSNQNNCFNGEEASLYMYKLIVVFRILILDEIGLLKCINKKLLKAYIDNIDLYLYFTIG